MKTTSPLLHAPGVGTAALESAVVSNMRIAVRGPRYESGTAFVADLSAIRKRLVVGSGGAEWITQHTGSCPQELFAIESLPDGACAVRIHRSQYLVIDGPDTDRYDELFLLPPGRHGAVLLLDYECAELAIGGPGVEDIIAELCPMPLDDLAPNCWCATRMAHADVQIRVIERPNRHFRCVVTPADARFVFEVISDAIDEHDGMQIGYNNYWQEFLAGGAK